MPIAEAKTGKGFGGLARYLITGHEGNNPERVDWIDARNLLSTDPDEAALVMAHTAARNGRVEKPVYHVSINWHVDDQPTPEQMRFAADRLLHDLGLQDHQVLMVAHRDTEHRHVHLMVNRVHPLTHLTWDNKNDYYQIRTSLNRLEKEMQWRVVAGAYRGLIQASDERLQWIRQQATAPMQMAHTWPDLENRLGKAGLALKARGRGLVVTDGRFYVKASDVDLSFSRGRLEERFGKNYRDWRNEVRRVQDLARQHFHRSVQSPQLSDARRLKASVDRTRHRARQLQTATEGSGDLRLIERKIAAFAGRYGMVILRRVSPAGAAILESIRLARRALDRERSR
jgi:hypothetical protein